MAQLQRTPSFCVNKSTILDKLNKHHGGGYLLKENTVKQYDPLSLMIVKSGKNNHVHVKIERGTYTITYLDDNENEIPEPREVSKFPFGQFYTANQELATRMISAAFK